MAAEAGAREQAGEARGRRLESWKAIARYLARDVRSVQRWEHERGLPIHRMPGEKGAVFAYEGELAAWMHSRPSVSAPAADAEYGSSPLEATVPTTPPRAGGIGFGRAGILLLALVIFLAAVAVLSWRGAELPRPVPIPPRSLAVLPMQNLSGDPAQDYFADGFTEELVTELAQLRSLLVISRTSTMIYMHSRKSLPEIARELHARYVLEGSVLREGGRVRVIAQLIDAATDTHVSARTYNADVKDVLDIQSRISRAIADDVRLDLSPEEKTRLARTREVDPAAHDLYLRASFEYAQQTPASIRQSLLLYKAAAARDPSFALAYVGIAQAETALLQITAESPDVSVRREKEALTKALAIDPHLGDARGLLASLDYWRDWDWPLAEREFRIALAEGAQSPTQQRFGSALVTRGRFEEGTAHLRTALELDPLGRSPRVNQFFGFYFQRRYGEARREMDDLVALSPDFLAGHALLGLVAKMQNHCAQSTLQADWLKKHYPSPLAEFVSALASSCGGDVASARESLQRAAASKGPAFASPYQIALGYAAIHDTPAALTYLEQSAATREPQVLYLKVEPLFDSLRSEARYLALERRLGLER